MNLLDDDDDVHDEHEYGMGSESRSQSHKRSLSGPSLSINQKFAEKYDAKKRTEELSKLKDKYGEADEDDDEYSSTDYSSEDSDAEFVTPEVDAAILNIIGRIRKGDTELYQDGKDFFDAEESRLAKARSASKTADQSKGKKEKAVKLKDYQRHALLAGVHNEDPEQGATAGPSGFRTHAQEEEDLRRETKAAFLQAFDGDEDEDGQADDEDGDGLLVRRDAREDSAEEEEDQYRRFLLENVGQAEMDRALAIQAENKRKAEASEEGNEAPKKSDDDFLKNYILNRGWLDKKSKHRPKYSEIVPAVEDDTPVLPAPGPSGANATGLEDDSADEFERAEEYETRYNFRFEEAAGGEIQTHGRDLGGSTSIRRVDDSRKKTRESAKARKEEEKRERMEELKRLKNLKKQDILERIAKIREVAGIADEGLDFSTLDLEGDYDPTSHAEKMAKVFGNQFYESVDANGKPVFEDDIDISDIVPEDDKYDEAYAPGGDAYDPTAPSTSGKKTRAERKKEKKNKKKSKGKERAAEEDGEDGAADDAEVDEQLAAALAPEAFDQISDPAERKRQIDAFMDDYYKLDYEDMVGDLPTRFHYMSSAASSLLNPAGSAADPFALSPAEILMATDAELNEYEALRKIAPYRQQGGKDGSNNKKRKKLKELRKRLANRAWGEELPEDDGDAGYRAADYTRKRKRDDQPAANGAPALAGAAASSEGPKKRVGKKEREKKRARAEAEAEAGEAAEA